MPGNPHMAVVGSGLLVDDQGKPLPPLQDFASIVASPNRQPARQHLEDFRQCEEDFRAFVLRKRKVDATVVDGVLQELLQTPLAGPTELVARVNAQLGRDDLTAANIESALEQISCVPVLRTLRRQLEAGTAHYQEAHLLTELLGKPSLPTTPPSRGGRPHPRPRRRDLAPAPPCALWAPRLLP